MNDEGKERLEARRQARLKRDEAEREAADERELAAEDMVEFYSKGEARKGIDFEVVNNRFGVHAIRKPDSQAILNWDRATKDQKMSIDWMINLLRNYILPDKAAGIIWAKAAAERPGLAWDTANAFLALMGVEGDENTKK